MSVYVYVFFVLIKKQSQAIRRQPVAHLHLILPLSLLSIILRISYNKNLYFSREQRRIYRSFCSAVAFCASEQTCYSFPVAFIHRASL